MGEQQKKRIVGYVKLAKLWERKEDEAREYHKNYYIEKYKDSDEFELNDVYIDITGNKNICDRPEMVRLIMDCMDGKVDVIATQTRAYLAANAQEFCYLFNLLRICKTDIITEDEEYNINTILNEENQVEELTRMSTKYISLNAKHYEEWIFDLIASFGALDENGDVSSLIIEKYKN